VLAAGEDRADRLLVSVGELDLQVGRAEVPGGEIDAALGRDVGAAQGVDVVDEALDGGGLGLAGVRTLELPLALAAAGPRGRRAVLACEDDLPDARGVEAEDGLVAQRADALGEVLLCPLTDRIDRGAVAALGIDELGGTFGLLGAQQDRLLLRT